MPRKILMPLTATAMAVLLWLLVGCTDGRSDDSGQLPERPQKERSTSRTSINPTEPTTASERTTGKHREGQQKERPCSSRATQPANDRRKPDENPHFRIAFIRNYSDEAYQTNIWVMDDGRDQTPLTKAGGLNEIFPAWAPDGKKIAFETTTDVYVDMRRVYVIDADGSNKTYLAKTHATPAGNFATPSWSPDGKKIAFTADDGIDVINVDGSDKTHLTKVNPKEHVEILDQSPTWSPDGKQIAFTRTAKSSESSDASSSASAAPVPEMSGLYVINADGTGLKNLFNEAETGSQIAWSSIAWSPDGKKIAFSASDVEAESEIFVTNVDDTGETQLTEIPDSLESSPTWQPNGEKIAFLSGGHGSPYDIYTINADGSCQTRLTKTAQNEGYLTWSPDGKKIAFARDTINEPEPDYWDIWDNIYIMSADGTGQNRLSAIHAVDFFGDSLSIVFVPEDRR
jgi:TolB protein